MTTWACGYHQMIFKKSKDIHKMIQSLTELEMSLSRKFHDFSAKKKKKRKQQQQQQQNKQTNKKQHRTNNQFWGSSKLFQEIETSRTGLLG